MPSAVLTCTEMIAITSGFLCRNENMSYGGTAAAENGEAARGDGTCRVAVVAWASVTHVTYNYG